MSYLPLGEFDFTFDPPPEPPILTKKRLWFLHVACALSKTAVRCLTRWPEKRILRQVRQWKLHEDDPIAELTEHWVDTQARAQLGLPQGSEREEFTMAFQGIHPVRYYMAMQFENEGKRTGALPWARVDDLELPEELARELASEGDVSEQGTEGRQNDAAI